jgi:putative MATE family efflux protein
LTFREIIQLVLESLRGEQRDYTTGSLPRAIILLAIPMILEMAMESLFAVVDIFWVSKLGDQAVATVGVTESLFALIFGIAMGLAIAATASVARRIGEKDPEAASHVAAQAVLLAATVSLAIGVVGAFFARDWLLLMAGSPDLAAYGESYARLALAFAPSVVMLFVFNAIFRGAGNAVIAMRALWLGNAINLVLDPVFIFGWGPVPAFGVTGAAIATSIGRTAAALYGLYCLLQGRGEIKLERRHWQLDWPLIRQVVALALPAAIQYLVPTASWVGLTRIIAMFGPAAIAGYTIAIRIIIFSILPAWGLSNAAATLVGQNLGAKQPDRAERSVFLCGWYNMVFLVSLGLVFIIFAESLIRVFTAELATVPVAVNCLRTLSYGYAFYAWGMVLVQSFNGAGDTRTPTWINFCCYWAFQLPLAYWLATAWSLGPNGAFWAVPVAESALALSSFLLFRRGTWKTVQV